jgi:PAS domain S-box-containing protein
LSQIHENPTRHRARHQAFLDLTGYTAEEVIGRNCRFLQGPDTCAAGVERIRQGLAEGRDVDVELLNYRKDGATFINQLAISPVIDKDGTLLYYFGSQKDVTERRRAELLEQSERRLLMEVDHRTMNALAVVQSIVRMSRGDVTKLCNIHPRPHRCPRGGTPDPSEPKLVWRTARRIDRWPAQDTNKC